MEVNLISTFAEFKELKNIDRPTMMSVLEDIFRTQLIKMYGSADNFDIIINIDKGDLEIWRNREVVEKVEDPNTQISLEEVHKIDPSYEVGEDFPEEVKLSDFGRRGILNLRQNLQGRIADIEKANLYNKYKDRIHEILVGEVYQVWKKEVLVMDEDGNELVLPKSEQIPSDYFKKGETVKAVIESVEMRNNTPVITLSRTSPAFLERLFEQEVPEIFDGLITIKKVVRIPGDRASMRRCQGLAYPQHRPRAAQREHRHHQLDFQHPASHPEGPQSGQDIVHVHRRGDQAHPRQPQSL